MKEQLENIQLELDRINRRLTVIEDALFEFKHFDAGVIRGEIANLRRQLESYQNRPAVSPGDKSDLRA